MRAIPRGLLLATALRLGAMAAVFASGFRAISDDDFARVVLAQEFAQRPLLDPTGSSWLPFPFWLTGGVMRLFGSELSVARALAALVCLACVPGVFLAARYAGLDKRSAGLSAALAALLPHAVWLGMATVPEGFSAVLCLIALGSTQQARLSARAWGTLCITLAAASRYEAWPVVGVVAFANAWDGVRDKRPALWALGAAACTTPLAWLAHGTLNHNSALFFVTRVANYRHALGESPAGFWDILRNYPAKLFSAEPELATLSLLVVGVSLFGVGGTARTTLVHSTPQHAEASAALLEPPLLRPTLLRPVLGATAVLAFLIVGDLRDGAPTHHAERPLLLVWLVLCLLVVRPLLRLWAARRTLALGVGAVALLVGGSYRVQFGEAPNFANREAEVALGQRLSAEIGTERVLFDTGDYGYLALAAGLNRPGQYAALNASDPRQAPSASWNSVEQLRARLLAANCQWLVTREARAAELRPLGQLMQLDGLVWLRIPTP